MPGMNRGDNIEEIYAWIDEVPFSKPKKNISRDFSDGVLMAELLKIYYPRFCDVHNYIPASNVAAKKENWNTLNRRILSKIDMKLNKEVINQLANAQPGIIEKVLIDLRNKISIKDSYSSLEVDNPIDIKTKENFIPKDDEEKIENHSSDMEIVKEEEKTGSLEVLNNPIVKTSNSLVNESESTKNLIGKACGWVAGWIWPFNGSQKMIEKESEGVKPLEKNCSKTEQKKGVEEKEEGEGEEDQSGISRTDFLRLRKEVEEKNLAINMLNRKVSCLESVMKLKDQKIGNLSAQISTPSSTEASQNLRPHVIGSSISRLRSAQTKNN